MCRSSLMAYSYLVRWIAAIKTIVSIATKILPARKACTEYIIITSATYSVDSLNWRQMWKTNGNLNEDSLSLSLSPKDKRLTFFDWEIYGFSIGVSLYSICNRLFVDLLQPFNSQNSKTFHSQSICNLEMIFGWNYRYFRSRKSHFLTLSSTVWMTACIQLF